MLKTTFSRILGRQRRSPVRWLSSVEYSEQQPDCVLDAEMEDKLHELKAASPNPVSLQDLPSSSIPMAEYLRKELPVRLAHRIHDLDHVPYLNEMKSVVEVKNIYINSFRQLAFYDEIENHIDEQKFRSLLHDLYQNHSSVLIQMAKGAYELREQRRKQVRVESRKRWLLKRQRDITELPETLDIQFENMHECHRFLDRFYMSRIGIRFLAGHYLALNNNSKNNNIFTNLVNPEQYTGLICHETRPYECIRQAIADATMLCRRTYGRAPFVEVSGNFDLSFPYIPSYLQYILLELLKNALRATMETHRNGSILPPVNIIIADGTEDIVIKIEDQGGGIRRSQTEQIWSYLFTTADPKIQKVFLDGQSAESPMAGLGYGLPISRSYCRYFGGDLDLISMDGHGTDAFLHLKRIGDFKEPVPV